MNFCTNCGAKIEGTLNFCPSCGKPLNQTNAEQPKGNNANFQNFQNAAQNINEKIQDFIKTNETPDDFTNEFEAEDIQENKGMALLSYIYILFLIPMLAAPNSKFAKFHVNQGIILFILNIIINIAISVVSFIFGLIPFIGWIGHLFNILRVFPVILMIIGIVNTSSGKAKELPIIGKYRLFK